MHPASCRDPRCELTYREHLLDIGIAASALPTRAVHRTPRSDSGYKPPDEPAWRTEAREKRWEADMPAFKRMHDAGQTPERIDGSAALERSLGG